MKLYLLMILSLLVSCSDDFNYRAITISELGRDTSLQITISKVYPTTLRTSIKGNADDTFRISGLKVAGGVVDTFWHSDWYQNTIILNYGSYKARHGQLKIEFKLY